MQNLIKAAKLLHWNYGKGDLKSVLIIADGSIEIIAQCTSCKPHTRKGRIMGDTVYMYRHQRTVR